jgi:pyruvyltransferase
MNRINLKWAKSEDENAFNFGDDLSPYIIRKLSNIEISYIHFAGTRYNITKQFLSRVYHGEFSKKLTSSYIKSFLARKYIISIGSIIQWYGSSRCVVWGSGIMNRKDKISSSKFLAVRGEYTKALIKKQGFKAPNVLGDPALLTPLIYFPIVKKKYKLGVIPHKIHYDSLKNQTFSDDILIIKLDSINLEKVIDDILSCDYTISTSLHGIIISHAYNIKSLWFKYDILPLDGDDVKFLDYFSSVKIPEYSAFPLNSKKKIDCDEIIGIILSNNGINCIKISIANIQKQLIDVAPFPIKPEFYNLDS